jgi:hypothetical protein
MRRLLRAETVPKEIRITRLWQTTEWGNVWDNLQTAPVPEDTKAMWYRVIQDLITTDERLHKIRLAPTDQCRLCAKKDTLDHRLTECENGTMTWEWTRQRIAMMLRTDPKHVKAELLLRPQFKLWPPQQHRAVL